MQHLFDSCFERLGGYLTIPFKQVLENLPLFRGQSVNLATVLIEAGIESETAKMRSQDAIMEIQGALVLVRILDDTAPFNRVIESLPEKLLS